MSSLSFLASELQALATETRRRYPDVREASDKAVALLRANPGAEGLTSLIDGTHGDELMKPVFLGCASKNAKVITLALSVLQRLIALKAVPFRALPQIISTMGEIISQGVDIQLRILQSLLSLVTTFPELHGAVLGDALLLCFHLQESRIAVVSSTAAATLRQLVMFIFEKVVMQKSASESHTIRLPDGTSTQLTSSELDAFCVFEDLCLLANAEPPRFLRLESLPKTFALELIESVLTNYHGLFHKRPEILLLLHHHLSPLLLKGLSEKPLFPLTLRSTRVVFLLLKQFPDELATEAEVFAMMLIRVISGEDSNASDGSRRPHWMRVLATEVIRGICNDADLMRRYWQLYDAGSEGSHVFAALIAALKRLVTERPTLLGVSHQMQGLGIHDGNTLEHVAGIVANAASTTVSGALGIPSSGMGLSMETCAMKLQCIDQLDKADAPMIPEGYIYVLGLQCIVSIAEGFAASTLPAFALLSPKGVDAAPMRLPPALDLDALDEEDETVKQLRIEKQMIEDGWPALLAALSFLISTNLSDELFSEVLAALQALTNVSGVLGLQTPRDAFLTSLSKLAIPTRVVSRLDSYVEPSTPRGAAGVVDGIAALAGASVPVQAPGLSDRNVACLKVLIFSASYLGGSLGSSWFSVLETLQNADYVLTNKGTRIVSSRKLPSALLNASMGKAASGTSTITEPTTNGYHPDRPLLLTDVEPEHVLMAIQGLFESTRDMSDEAFNHFTVALCKLSAEMIGMQVSADLDESLQEDVNGAPMSPTAAYAHRRRVSGIQLTRTPRAGDFSVNKLGTISQLNINRLLYIDDQIAWRPITSHLMTILRHPLAPASLRIQAAQNLDGVLVVIPRSLQNLDQETVKIVQQRSLDVLASQVTTEGGSSTVVDIRRMGLDTLHQILQTGSHTLLVGWEVILEMLASVCRPSAAPTSIPMVPEDSIPNTPIVPITPHTRGTPSLNTSFLDKPNIPLIRSAFQSLTLVCDNLLSLSSEQLKLCISTLGLFGRQMDTNIALTAAESLLWGVSDSIQMRRKDPDAGQQYNELWMFLLSELLFLCTDARPEVRGGSIQTLFRTMQLYGLTLSLEMWQECIWTIVFPLLDSLRGAAAMSSPDGEGSSSSKSDWDESKILALQSIGAIFNDFLMSKLVQLSDFEQVWNTFVQQIQSSVLEESKPIITVALRSIDKALKSFKDPVGINKAIADRSCETLWTSWETMGRQLTTRPNGVYHVENLTHENFVAFVDVVKTLRGLSKSVKGQEWTLQRLKELLIILRAVQIYPLSDFRPDVDALTPLQNNILAVYESVDLSVSGSPSLVLSDYAYFVTLAFSETMDQTTPTNKQDSVSLVKKSTYIAMCKRIMPLLSHLYSRFKASVELYSDGTVEAILKAYSIPIKLKYDCPLPSKFGSDPPLWKSATTTFISVARDCIPRIAEFPDLSDERIEGIWRCLLEVFEGALMADCSSAAEDLIDEVFDHVFIATIETHLSAHLGHERVPNEIIIEFGKVLQHASKIHEPGVTPTHVLHEHDTNEHFEEEPMAIQNISNDAEDGYELVGTTLSINILPRERFSYWCFDLLYYLCSSIDDEYGRNRRRVAALCLPHLLARVSQVLLSYCLDIQLHGEMPLSRAREEEVLYVLNKMLNLNLWSGSLWASQSEDPTRFANELPESISGGVLNHSRDLAYKSSRAHLFYCYNLLLQIVSAPKSTTAWLPPTFFASTSPSVSETDSPVYVHYDSRSLANACLKLIGEEMGLPWSLSQ